MLSLKANEVNIEQENEKTLVCVLLVCADSTLQPPAERDPPVAGGPGEGHSGLGRHDAGPGDCL